MFPLELNSNLIYRMKNIYSLLICALAGFSANAQVPTIAQVRASSLNSTVTATGVVTTGSTLGNNIRYFQDATGGLVAYGGTYTNVNIGDSITVTGPLVEFSGLLEIGSGPTAAGVITNHGPAVVPVTPLVLSMSAVNESKEGMLVRLDNVQFQQSGTFVNNTNYTLVSVANPSQTLQFRGNLAVQNQAIPTGPISIVAVVSQFNTNYQLLCRGMSDMTTYVAPIREIDVLVDGAHVTTGSSVNLVGGSTFPVTIENQGSGVLTVSNIAFSGANAADFTPSATSTTVAAYSTQVINVTYAPTTDGTHTATLTISNDDADESEYLIHFTAGGVNGLVDEPTSNATALTFSNVKAYTVAGSFAPATNATRYIVLWKEGSAVTEAPVDGTTYERGDIIGGAKVAYIGPSTSFTPRGIRANKVYHFAVFALNGQGGNENYVTVSPATGSVTSGGSTVGNYYESINPSAPNFISSLTGLISQRQMITYYNYRQTFMQEFDLKDTTNGRTYAECRYSGYRNAFEGTFDWTTHDFSREHVYAHSWMPGNPFNANNTEQRPYNDQHNLFPTKYLEVNSTRSNFPFGNVVQAYQSFMGSKRGLNANNETVFEPQESVKGDVARALFYQAVAYNNYNGTNTAWGFPTYISFLVPYGQDIDVLLDWHFNDLPDSYEIARHEYVASVQNNRNPFIDNPEWACLINFRTITAQECNMSATELSLNNIQVYPNPAKESVTIFGADNSLSGFEVIDMQGRTIMNESTTNNMVSFDVTNFTMGTYLVKVYTDKGTAVKKLIIE